MKKERAKAKEGDKRIGNKFWELRSKHGRDKLFATPQLMWEAACEYFKWIDENPLIEIDYTTTKGGVVKVEKPHTRPYTIQGLCLYLDCGVRFFSNFEESLTENDKDFKYIITRIRETIFKQKFEGAACGFYNANLIARELGISDKQETKTEHTGEINITGMEIR